MKFGFTNITGKGIEKKQSVLYKVFLRHEFMKSSKLKRHLRRVIRNTPKKDMEFFRQYEASCKRQRLDRTGSFHQGNTALVQASHEVATENAKQKKKKNRRKSHQTLHVEDGEVNS